MNIIKNIKYTVAIAALGVAFTSCEDFLDLSILHF